MLKSPRSWSVGAVISGVDGIVQKKPNLLAIRASPHAWKTALDGQNLLPHSEEEP